MLGVWLARVLGFGHEKGLSPARRSEVARVQVRSQRVLRRSVRMRTDIMVRAAIRPRGHNGLR